MKNAIIILSALSLVACDTDSFSEEAAYQEAMMGSEARQVVDNTVAFHKPGRPMGPLDLVEQMRSFIEVDSDCAQVTTDGDQITVDFGADGCEYMDRTFTGSVSAVFSEQDTQSLMQMTFEDLSDGIVTLSGAADASLSDTQRTIAAALDVTHTEDAGCMRGESMSPPEGERETGSDTGPPKGNDDARGGEGPPPRPPSAFTLIVDREVTALDGDFEAGIRMDGIKSMIADQGEVLITETGVEVRSGEVVPQAGQITHDGPRGGATMTFTRLSDTIIAVSVDGPRGAESFQVDPATGERL